MISRRTFIPGLVAAAVLAVPLAFALHAVGTAAAEGAVTIPAPAVDEPASGDTETVVLAGGGFWGVQGVFAHVKGVDSAVSGYAGGTVANPSYQHVRSENPRPAQAGKITLPPK